METLELSPLYKLATRFRHMGLSTIPFRSMSKEPDLQLLKSRGYKGWSQFQSELPKDDDLLYWFNRKRNGLQLFTPRPDESEWDEPNLFVILDENHLVIDFDINVLYVIFAHKNPEVVRTLKVRTARGWHLYYKLLEPLPNDLKATNVKIELRTNGLGVIAAGIHPSGARYIVDESYAPKLMNADTLISLGLAKIVSVEDRERETTTRGRTLPLNLNGHTKPISRLNPRYQGWNLSSMARDIKRRYELRDFLQSKGCQLTSNNDKGIAMANCPAHDDKTPSLWIGQNKAGCMVNGCNLYSTGRGYDLIDLYAILSGRNPRDKFDFRDVVYELADYVGL